MLQGWLRAPVEVLSEAPGEIDLALQSGGRTLLVQVKGSDDVATLERAAVHLARSGGGGGGGVAVPYMGPKAREWAAGRGISWVDLSGNAEIRDRDLCIIVAGNSNRYSSAGRPSNPFTPRYARVSRALLAHPDRWWKQVEIADEVGLPSGTVSKVVQGLDRLDLLEHNQADELRARAQSLLLDSWAQRYRFGDHAIRRYHLTARSGEDALRIVAENLAESRVRFAATGLSAAWLYTAFAGFRINSFFVEQHPSDPEALGLRPVERGENVWLVVPRDEGVFYGAGTPRHLVRPPRPGVA